MADNNKDIEQKVKITYDTNAGETAKEVNKLDDSIEDVNDSQKKVIKTQKKVNKSQKDTTKSAKDQKKGLEDLGGGIGSAIKGFKGLIKQMWLVVANPVGLIILAIVGGLALLFKAFTSTKGGAEKFEQIMSGIGATIDVLRDRVLKIATAIGKFFSGDFKGAIAVGREAVSGFGAEVAEEFRKAAEATKSLQEVADAMRDLGVTRAKLNRDLAKAEFILTDINATYEEKLKALELVSKAEKKQTDAELAAAEKKLAAIRAQNALSDSSAESLQAEADAQIAVFDLQKKSAEDKRKVAEFTKKIDGEESARLKGLSDQKKQEAADQEKIQAQKWADYLKEDELIKKKREDEEKKREDDKRIAEEDAQFLQDVLDEEERLQMEAEDLRLENAQKAADKEAAIEQAKLDQKKAIQAATFGLLADGLNALKGIFSKNKKVQKGILIAENAVALSKLTMNTITAVTADNAASPLTFGMPWAGIHIAQGAIGAANIIASTAKGLKELGGGSAGTAPNLGGGSRGGGSAAPNVGFQTSAENQIATTIADNTNALPPQEAFVVSHSMTSQQALDRNKQTSNSLG
jgi:hypothetical protein